MNKKTSHSPHHLHGIRILLFGVLLIAVFLVRINPTGLSAAHDQNGVLAYATSMNRTDLLGATNSYRVENGLNSLVMNAQLNTASQNKAQHMIDNNYWAHVAPDGTQPWYFFDQAGYDYRSAGENLAYGFTTSYATVDAWMNSPSHRANILGDYIDIGFGIVNGPSYQGGENTVVVAHYGTQRLASAAPAPVASTAPTPPSQQTAPSQPAQTVVPTSPEVVVPVTEATKPALTAPLDATDQSPKKNTSSDMPPVIGGTSKDIKLIERIQFGNAPPLAIASLAMTVTASLGFAFTHRSLMRHAMLTGEKFVLHHPAVDTVALTAVSALILTSTVGHIG